VARVGDERQPHRHVQAIQQPDTAQAEEELRRHGAQQHEVHRALAYVARDLGETVKEQVPQRGEGPEDAQQHQDLGARPAGHRVGVLVEHAEAEDGQRQRRHLARDAEHKAGAVLQQQHRVVEDELPP
jgi:hypothetical protein